jgi:hypothetical protein
MIFVERRAFARSAARRRTLIGGGTVSRLGVGVDMSTDDEYHPGTFLNAYPRFVTQGELKIEG